MFSLLSLSPRNSSAQLIRWLKLRFSFLIIGLQLPPIFRWLHLPSHNLIPFPTIEQVDHAVLPHQLAERLHHDAHLVPGHDANNPRALQQPDWKSSCVCQESALSLVPLVLGPASPAAVEDKRAVWALDVWIRRSR